MLNTIINADCLEAMKDIPDESVDAVITSPPYDNIMEYNGSWMLDLPSVGKQISRVLKDGGTASVLIQDQTIDGHKSLTTFKMIVDWCANTDLKLWECLIYKRSGMPGGWWSKRFRVDHEYIPVFVKGKKPIVFDKEHMKVPSLSKGRKKIYPLRRKDDFNIQTELKYDVAPTKCIGTIWDFDEIKARENGMGKAKQGIKSKHPATFPDKFAENLIRTFTTEGMLVLDPMCGSGTTCVVAQALKRNFIGIDISKEYCDIASERLENGK